MRRRYCKGVAALEFALVLLAFTAIMLGFLSIGRMMMVGMALDRATTDAARYMATVPVEDLRDSTRRAALLANTRSVLEQGLAASGIQASDLTVGYVCGNTDCNTLSQSNPLESIIVTATVNYSDGWFGIGERTELTTTAGAGRDN
ncbi:TadE family protein [Pseudoduganella sp. OTU4001]|uniref:TadE family protein n=1 Tax=Pseudoduganella sp. OTU4001 TaxID=3043854 RepID=UPI00313E9196